MSTSKKIQIQVRDRCFTTTRGTTDSSHADGSLIKTKAASALPDPDDGITKIFFDRNPVHFDKVLDFLSNGWIALNPGAAHPQLASATLDALRELRYEASYYNIAGLKNLIDKTNTMRAYFEEILLALHPMDARPGDVRAADPNPGSLRNRRADYLYGLLQTASREEIEAAEDFKRRCRLTLKVVGLQGDELGELHVSAFDTINTLHDSEDLHQLKVKAGVPDGLLYGGVSLLLTRLQADLLEHSKVYDHFTFEFLGVKDGETLTLFIKDLPIGLHSVFSSLFRDRDDTPPQNPFNTPPPNLFGNPLFRDRDRTTPY